MNYFLGMDGGGTKTIAVVADEKGIVRGVGRAGCINFQEIGTRAAAKELSRAYKAALKSAGVKPDQIVASGYGICGADRDKDYFTVLDMISTFDRSPMRILVNDTSIALRAGTPDGVGVACISGTGANVMGFNREGMFKRAGGLGPLSADWGGGMDVAVAAINAAMKQGEGRGHKTAIYDMIMDHFKLGHIEDLIEFGFRDINREHELGQVTPIVFKAAANGDKVAREILENVGRSIGGAAKFVISQLFKPGEPVTVALGGSVFMRGTHELHIETLKKVIGAKRNPIKVVKLTTEPAVGGVLLAMDLYHGRKTSVAVTHRIAGSLKKYLG
jgi:N-acetylglucosamine kinase-like BadF-type ATPase